MSGHVGGSSTVSSLAESSAIHPVRSECLLRRQEAVLKGKEYSSKPVERQIAGETEDVRRWITACCLMWNCCYFPEYVANTT